MWIRCNDCGTYFTEYQCEVEEIDNCVGCGMSPCYHCTAITYLCPNCNSDDTEESREPEEGEIVWEEN